MLIVVKYSELVVKVERRIITKHEFAGQNYVEGDVSLP